MTKSLFSYNSCVCFVLSFSLVDVMTPQTKMKVNYDTSPNKEPRRGRYVFFLVKNGKSSGRTKNMVTFIYSLFQLLFQKPKPHIS